MDVKENVKKPLKENRDLGGLPKSLFFQAEPTRPELATSDVTGGPRTPLYSDFSALRIKMNRLQRNRPRIADRLRAISPRDFIPSRITITYKHPIPI